MINNRSELLFLYLKTGGGHLAPACAIRDWMEEQHGEGVSITLHDGFDKAPSTIRALVEDGYSYSQAHAKWLFELLYAMNKLLPIAWITSTIVSYLIQPALEKAIEASTPDKIVIFHFLLIKPIRAILKRKKLSIPVVTVVTDPYTAHPIWFIEPEQHYVVFSHELKDMILQKQLPIGSVSVFPFAINPKFSATQDQAGVSKISRMLGLAPNRSVILVMGGADGMPHGERLIKNLCKENPHANVVIVCGRNKNLQRRALALKEYKGYRNLIVLGYINYVRELLTIADIVVTKCGASTFMEVLISGKIPLINSYIWEQEKGNVDFIKRNGMGIYEPNPKLLAKLARELTMDSNYSKSFKDNIARMNLGNGTPHISDYILGFNPQQKNEYSNMQGEHQSNTMLPIGAWKRGLSISN